MTSNVANPDSETCAALSDGLAADLGPNSQPPAPYGHVEGSEATSGLYSIDPLIGSVVNERYVIEKRIGDG